MCRLREFVGSLNKMMSLKDRVQIIKDLPESGRLRLENVTGRRWDFWVMLTVPLLVGSVIAYATARGLYSVYRGPEGPRHVPTKQEDDEGDANAS